MRWQAQFVLVAVMWGASFMFIKIQLDGGISPVHVAWLRCVLGSAALLAIVRFKRESIRGTRRCGGISWSSRC